MPPDPLKHARAGASLGPWRHSAWLAVWVITAVHVAAAPFAALHMDLARDLFVAQRILSGEHYPWIGPVFGGAFHLGPSWYYGLAGLLGLTGSLTWTVLVVTAINSLKFPLAFAAGVRLGRPDLGLVWVALLALPGWTSLFMVFGQHPGLVEPLAVITLGLALAYLRSGRRITLAATGLVFSLALHGHPSAVLLVWPLAAVMLWRWRRNGLDVWALFGAAVAFALPWLPFVVHEAMSGWANLGGVAGYLRGQAVSALDALMELPTLATGALSGPGYWLATVAGIDIGNALGMGLLGLALLLVVWTARQRWVSKSALIGFLLLVAASSTLLLLREVVPYYMLAAWWVLATGLLAGCSIVASGPAAAEPITTQPTDARPLRGFADAASQPQHRADYDAPVRVIAAGLAMVGALATTLPIVSHQRQGDWPLAFMPMFDVMRTQVRDQPTPFLLIPAYALDPLGRWLCDSPSGRAVHGPLAHALFLDYAMPARQIPGCRLPEAGGDATARDHWLGMPRHMAEPLAGSAELTIGPVHLYRVRRIVLASSAWPALAEPTYPPLQATATDAESRQLRLRLDAGERLLLSDVFSPAYPWPQLRLMQGERVLEPVASELGARVYACTPACGALELTITGPALQRMEAVVF